MKTVLILVIFLSLNVWAGNSVGNGGDDVAQEFTTLARLAVKNLSAVKTSAADQKNIEKIQTALESVHVSSEKQLFLNGKEVDAINQPTKLEIAVSRSRWKELKDEKIQTRIALVLHEYLGVVGLDDQHYALSEKLMGYLTPTGFADFDAQASYLKMASVLQALFWDAEHDVPLTEKQICLFSGEIKSRVQILTEFSEDHPNWFRSEKIQKYIQGLNEVSLGLQDQCLVDQKDYTKLEQLAARGEDQSGYLAMLLWK